MTQSKKQTASQTSADQPAMSDFKNASLVVSLLLNAVLLIGFMVVQVTSVYDHQVISLLLTG